MFVKLSVLISFVFFDFESVQCQIFGKYCRSNPVADYGITTIIHLNTDSTFKYELIGHMIYDKARGQFKTTQGNIIAFQYDTSTIDELVVEHAPKRMVLKGEKLFELDKEGHLVRSKRLLSFQRRFFFFGERSRKRKVYLVKESDSHQCS